MKSTVITADSRNIHNYYIDIFRFLLILWIVLFHYTVQYNALGLDKPFVFPYSFENGGTVGVSLFFMVSGFFMTKTLMSDKYGFREYGRYLARRYLRLWIPYAFACIILYLWLLFLPVEGRTVDLSTLLANVACVIHPGFDRVDNAHWFIADLLVVQLLLGLLIFVRNNRYKQIIINCLFVIVMVAQVIHPPLLSGFSKELFEVLLGTHIWMMVKDRDIRSLILTLIGLAVVVYLSIYMFIGAVVFFTIVLLGEKCPPQKSINGLALTFQFAGTISFYWYLVHQNIGYSIMYHYLPNDNNMYWLLIPMITTLGLSFLVYFFDNIINRFVINRIHFLNK